MKRSAALAPLSRDHQHALEAALRLRRADEATVRAAVQHFLSFFADEGRRHFEIEEAAIVPALPRDDAAWDAAVRRLEDDHAAIRRTAADFERSTPTVEGARSLGERLNAHVRFEERELFEILEQRLPAERLRLLGEEIERLEGL